MIGLTVTCASRECNNEFTKVTHNQKYCSPECCRVETNINIMLKYHEKRSIRNGKKRFCSVCNHLLSKYNETNTCNACTLNKKHKHANELTAILDAVTWS